MRNSAVFPAIIALLAVIVIALFGISTFADLAAKKSAASSNAPQSVTAQIPSIDFANPARGAKDAKVSIVVFGDYQCGACAQTETTLTQILKDFPTQVRVVWKDLPNISIHEQAMTAAIAARCAGLQDAFWIYHDRLFANQASLNADSYVALAEGLVPDILAFKSCILEEQTQPIVQRDIDEAIALNINATPFLFIGDRKLSGSLDFDSLKMIVTAAVAAPDASK